MGLPSRGPATKSLSHRRKRGARAGWRRAPASEGAEAGTLEEHRERQGHVPHFDGRTATRQALRVMRPQMNAAERGQKLIWGVGDWETWGGADLIPQMRVTLIHTERGQGIRLGWGSIYMWHRVNAMGLRDNRKLNKVRIWMCWCRFKGGCISYSIEVSAEALSEND